MLVLSRKSSEGLVLDGRIRVRILSVRGTRVKLGIEAPDDVEIVRDELMSQALLWHEDGMPDVKLASRAG